MSTSAPRSARRIEPLSKRGILDAAIALLDAEADGGPALTLRSLMTRLSTGAGAIYHHVANMDEVRAAAADDAVRLHLEAVPSDATPTTALRGVAVGIYDALGEHAWLGPQLTRSPLQPAVLRIWKTIGQQLQLLELSSTAASDAGSTLVNYVLGAAAQRSAGPGRLPLEPTRAAFLEQLTDELRALDPDPLAADIAEQLQHHDDRAQFLSGVDIVLRGITA